MNDLILKQFGIPMFDANLCKW